MTMDNTQNPNPQVQNPSMGQQGNNQTASQPAQPISGGLKEQPPLPSAGPSEWIAPSTPEVHIPQELQEHMEATPVPSIPQDVNDAGVKMAKEETPITLAADEALGLNTSPSVLITLKKAHSSVKESIRWLAEVIGLAQKKRDEEIAHPSTSNSIQRAVQEKEGKA